MFLTATQVEELMRAQAKKERESLNKIWEPFFLSILNNMIDNNLESGYNDHSTNKKELHTHGNSHTDRQG